MTPISYDDAIEAMVAELVINLRYQKWVVNTVLSKIYGVEREKVAADIAQAQGLIREKAKAEERAARIKIQNDNIERKRNLSKDQP